MSLYLSLLDFVVLILFLLASASFGVYHACRGGHQRSADEYLLADRSMHPIPVAISVVVSALSAVTYLGVPAEIYVHGPQYGIVVGNKLIVLFFVVFSFCPVLYRLKLTSINEYLEIRFNRHVRYLCAGIIISAFPIFMGISIYGPALALNAVSGLSLPGSIIVSGFVCTFYSTIGGIKAVMWADVFQSMIMLCGFLVTAIACCIQVGGLAEVFHINARDGRDTVFDFRIDPRVRHSFWAVFFGLGVQAASYIGCSQMIVQRYMTCRTLRQSQAAAGIGTSLMGLVELIAVITGVCMYAFYAGCDPVSSGKVSRADQLMVYIVVDLFENTPGVAGFIISAVFSSALSTTSSGINAIAAVVGYDVIKTQFPGIQGVKFTFVLKVVSVIFGLISILTAFLASIMGPILPLTLTIAGAFMSPIFGVFCLGIFFPWSNAKGALVGLICALATGIWLVIGSQMYPPVSEDPPLFTDQCDDILSMNGTTMMTSLVEPTTSATIQAVGDLPMIAQIYSLSYAYFAPLNTCITICVGMIVSLLTGPTDTATLDPTLVSPLIRTVYCCKTRGRDDEIKMKETSGPIYEPVETTLRGKRTEV